MRIVIASEVATIQSGTTLGEFATSATLFVKPEPKPRLDGDIKAYAYLNLLVNDSIAGDCVVVGEPAVKVSSQSYLQVNAVGYPIPAKLFVSEYVKSNKDVGMRLETVGAFADEEAKGTFFWG